MSDLEIMNMCKLNIKTVTLNHDLKYSKVYVILNLMKIKW